MKKKKSHSSIKSIINFQFPNKELALLWRIPFTEETEPSKVERSLRERIKELNCLYGVLKLAERHPDSVEHLLMDMVNFLPFSWQFPEITCARITFNGKTFKSKGFKITNWRMSSQIFLYNEAIGEVEIFYTKECPPVDEGPFLEEERALLNAVAEQIGNVAARISAEKELHEINRLLTVERKALQETNTAIRTVLSRIEEEKQEIYSNISANVEKVLMPILHALAMELPQQQKKYIEMLKSSLEDIMSPFIRNLSHSCHSLTPAEISICNMIRNGMHTKEIAQIRGVTNVTINRHRENIRRKLKITNAKVNLATYLQVNMWKGKD